MKKEYSALLESLLLFFWKMHGCGCAFAAGGYHGLALAIRAEAAERWEYFEQCLHHMEGQGMAVDLPALPAPVTSYPTALDAMHAVCIADGACLEAVDVLFLKVAESGNPVYFIAKLKGKMDEEYVELCGIRDMVASAEGDKEKMNLLNLDLLKKYTEKDQNAAY